MLWKKSISQSPRTSQPINIISSFSFFTSLRSNWRTPYSSSHSAKSQRLYEVSEVRPTVNLELFRTAILKYPFEFSCWYIVVVKGKGTEVILSARMNHFTIAQFRHFTISPLRRFTVSYFCFVISFIFILRREPLSLLGPSHIPNIIYCPLISNIFLNPSAKFHTSYYLVPYRKQKQFPFQHNRNRSNSLRHDFWTPARIFDHPNLTSIKSESRYWKQGYSLPTKFHLHPQYHLSPSYSDRESLRCRLRNCSTSLSDFL